MLAKCQRIVLNQTHLWKYHQQTNMSTSSNTCITRAANKSTHPGIPDIDDEVMSRPPPKPRRTKAQVAADNVATAEKKAAKAEEAKANNEKRAQLIAWIATLEKKMIDDEQLDESEAARPAKKKIVMVVKSPKGMNTHLFECVLHWCLGIGAATHRKNGPVNEKGRSNVRKTGNDRDESSSQKNIPDFGEFIFAQRAYGLMLA